MPLLLVIPDPPAVALAGDAVLDLPALSGLMLQGKASTPDRDWRCGLLRDLGAAGLAAAAPAEIASHALQLAPGRSVCMATPVHAVAGMNRVHLHAAGVLQLAPEQRSRFQSEFATQFGDEVLLHGVGEGWVLEAPWAHVADDGDPSGWRGAPLSRGVATTPEQRTLRRIGAEIEMWLAGSGWNQSAGRGELPPNLLWLWGGGRAAERFSLPAMPGLRMTADRVDPWLAGVAALAHESLQPLPEQWNHAQCSDAAGRNALQVFVLPAAGMDMQRWQELERRWFEPLLRDLRARHIESLTLRLGPRNWQIRPPLWRRLLRRSTPWWQAARA